MPRHHKSRPRLGQGSEVRVGAHAWKRQVSTIRGVGGSRVDVYVVARPVSCAIFWSVSVLQNWACIHVVVVPWWWGAWYVFGVRADRPFSCIYNYYCHHYYYYISMGRYGRVYRLWASASSGAYRRVMQVAGPCDVYRTVFCTTLRSLNVRTYSARVPPPSQLLYCVGLSILTAVSL